MTSPSLRGVLARALPVVIVLITTLVAFRLGVDVSERPGVPDATPLVQLYYAVGLFVLGGVDLGTPVGGPTGARWALWAAYFLGPAITTTAVVESAVRLTRPVWAQRIWNRDHVVILGQAPVGAYYAMAVDACDVGRRVLRVPMDQRDQLGHGLDLAHRIVVAATDDLDNLGVAWELAQTYPGRSIDVHVGQLGLREAADALEAHEAITVFNAYAITAEAVYASVLRPHLAATPQRDVVAILGFGRFGQTVLRRLNERSAEEVAQILLVDRNAERKVRQYREHSSKALEITSRAVDADLRDPAAWDVVTGALRDVGVQPIVLVATDDDTTNLQAAVGLRQRLPNARVFVRWASESPFLRAVELQHDVEGLAVEDALRDALVQHYQG